MTAQRIGAGIGSSLTAKGDIQTYTTTPARLPVGTDGQTLVANSANASGLGWNQNFAAGKNKIINGDFYINQRNFTSNTTAIYGFDRWAQAFSGGTSVTNSAQVFTPGTAPVAGYEGKNYNRQVTVGQSAAGDYAQIIQRIESVRTLANQTATISFWAKSASGTPKISVELQQNFGTGGSPSATVVTNAGQVTLSTSWARYSVTVSVPSISGATFGTNNDDMLVLALWTSAGSTYAARTGSMGTQNNTFDLWGVQVEPGSVATAFQTATGTLQGELAAAQRYYVRIGDSSGASNQRLARGSANSTTSIQLTATLPVQLRTGASSTIDYANLQWYNGSAGVGAISSVTMSATSTTNPAIAAVTTGVVSGTFYELLTTSTSGYIGFSAEL